MDKVAAFCIGNAIGLTVLFGGVLLSESRKMKEAQIVKTPPVHTSSELQIGSTKVGVSSLQETNQSEKNSQSQSDSMFARKQNTPDASNAQKPNVVATKNIEVGHTLTDQDLNITDSSISDAERTKLFNNFVGKTTIISISKGTALTQESVRP